MAANPADKEYEVCLAKGSVWAPGGFGAGLQAQLCLSQREGQHFAFPSYLPSEPFAPLCQQMHGRWGSRENRGKQLYCGTRR